MPAAGTGSVQRRLCQQQHRRALSSPAHGMRSVERSGARSPMTFARIVLEVETCSCAPTAIQWHLRCTAEASSEAPTGDWMCGLCVAAERCGEDRMQHGLVGEDDAADGAGLDPSALDVDDEEATLTYRRQAAYDKAGVLPYPPNIWDASSMGGLQRGPRGLRSPFGRSQTK